MIAPLFGGMAEVNGEAVGTVEGFDVMKGDGEGVEEGVGLPKLTGGVAVAVGLPEGATSPLLHPVTMDNAKSMAIVYVDLLFMIFWLPPQI